MEQESTRSALVTVLVALALGGCQKTDEIPAPQTQGSEAPAPEVQASEPAAIPGTPPSMEPAPMESAPGDGTPSPQ